ncbi:hypothetical protein CERSUDRAFT_98603 [Gelatoporia subvermispora B]|uniref:Uncharacterized protein n=1 Tax=Ceriporiopsis subvermispora (strain B) TaxID=914234 RepID=M2R3K8_CERS8|nr:hypothetical protein CERSUDRAFT_98603 [Gelatoporia subvermispora B]
MANPNFIIPESVEYLPCGRKIFQAFKQDGTWDVKVANPGCGATPGEKVVRFNQWVAHEPREIPLRGALFWRSHKDIPGGPAPKVRPIPRRTKAKDPRLLPVLLEALWWRVAKNPAVQAAYGIVLHFLDDPEPLVPPMPTTPRPDDDTDSSKGQSTTDDEPEPDPTAATDGSTGDNAAAIDGTTSADGATDNNGTASADETTTTRGLFVIDEEPELDDTDPVDATTSVDGMLSFDGTATTMGLFAIDEMPELYGTTSIDEAAATDEIPAHDMTPSICDASSTAGTTSGGGQLIDWDDTLAWMKHGDLSTMLRDDTDEPLGTLQELLKAAEIPQQPGPGPVVGQEAHVAEVVDGGGVDEVEEEKVIESAHVRPSQTFTLELEPHPHLNIKIRRAPQDFDLKIPQAQDLRPQVTLHWSESAVYDEGGHGLEDPYSALVVLSVDPHFLGTVAEHVGMSFCYRPSPININRHDLSSDLRSTSLGIAEQDFRLRKRSRVYAVNAPSAHTSRPDDLFDINFDVAGGTRIDQIWT